MFPFGIPASESVFFIVRLLFSIHKFFLHLITRKSEIERICLQYGDVDELACSLNHSILHSKQLSHLSKKIMTVDVTTISEEVSTTKNISSSLVKVNLDLFGQKILRTQEILQNLTLLSKEAYNSENEDHEKKLLQFWNILKPSVPLPSRKTKRWQELGFQGEDPATDFRGMGILGLDNLLYFASNYTQDAQRIADLDYGLAIAGINLTYHLMELLKEGSLNHYFFCTCATVQEFHILYCKTFLSFAKYSIENNGTQSMQFPIMIKQYLIQLKLYLRNQVWNTKGLIYFDKSIEAYFNPLTQL
eukprot:TRINITY_DN13261_c0_g1_i1.p1 TRINITY_DN13261_c0_g1~~TRINITY_DN13261_c0_g1_i1.p1  ORF type:complete len:303 (+),score=30.02 TRINITY_DN13261_c0_g1_i1:51-959(+)